MTKDLPALLIEIEDGLQWLRSNLPTHIEGMEVSSKSKIPYKALTCRAAFGWRFAELCRSASEALQNERLVSGILLTRAAAETCAGVWYLSTRLRRAVEEKSLGNADDRLMRLLCGNKSDAEMPDPVHVNDFIAAVEKQAPGFQSQYDRLSEFAHPNWAGTLLSYSKSDPDERCTFFGPYLRQAESIRVQGVVGLSIVLLMFRKVFNDVGDVMPAFTAVCEQQIGHAV